MTVLFSRKYLYKRIQLYYVFEVYAWMNGKSMILYFEHLKKKKSFIAQDFRGY